MELPPPPERSKRLHNFTLPYLRWGQQRFLRCVKLPHHNRSPSFPSSSSSPSPDHRSHNGGLSGELRLDLVYDANRPKLSVLGNGGDNNNGDVVAAARPWNLRTRRAACNEPPGDDSTRIIESSSSLRRHEIGVKRGGSEDGGDSQQNKNEKVKFSVSLLREEIEQDFSALIGKRPPRRPKKRPRLVQKQMNVTSSSSLYLSRSHTIDLCFDSEFSFIADSISRIVVSRRSNSRLLRCS